MKLPYLLVVINIICACQYLYAGDYPRVWYWISAAVLTYSTIIMK